MSINFKKEYKAYRSDSKKSNMQHQRPLAPHSENSSCLLLHTNTVWPTLCTLHCVWREFKKDKEKWSWNGFLLMSLHPDLIQHPDDQEEKHNFAFFCNGWLVNNDLHTVRSQSCQKINSILFYSKANKRPKAPNKSVALFPKQTGFGLVFDAK